MADMKFYELDSVTDSRLTFVIVVSQYKGKWGFCLHKEKGTYEIPEGFRDENESIYETAKRKLFEETGAVDFELTPICICSKKGESESFGILYFAEVKEIGALPVNETMKIEFFECIPDKLTSSYTHQLIERCLSKIRKNLMTLDIREVNQVEPFLVELLDNHSRDMNPEMPLDYGKKEVSFGVYDGDKIIGGIIVKERLGEYYISLLAVSEEYRGLGIGRLLIQAVEKKAKENHCHHILLTTYSYQGASFYPKVGFTQLAQISDYPIVGVDKLYFIKYL